MSITVSQLVGYIKNRFDQDPNLQGLFVQGEISNFHRQMASGHLYFTLKDERSSISCVMFKSNAISLKFEPKNGDKVQVTGKVSVFEQSGSMQLYVTSIKPDGLGDLFMQYEILKNRLKNEGYFDESNKKKLKTRYLSKVAVLVGDHSAAMSDIKTCFLRRWPLCEADYYPVLVQGAGAAKNIIDNLVKVDEMGYEAIILARGGGSFEDLFEFNNEELVKTIYRLKTFIVTGVGHEQDFTLADFVADLRAPTPTACVELITVDIKDVKNRLNELTLSECFLHPESIFDNKKMQLDYLTTRLLSTSSVFKGIENSIMKQNIKMGLALKNVLRTNEKELLIRSQSLKESFLMKIQSDKKALETQNERMKHAIIIKNTTEKNRLERYISLLIAYNKDNILKRGFALVHENGHIVKNLNELKGREIEVEFIDGSINASVTGRK